MMNQSIINQRIRVALPPEFHQMDPEEKKKDLRPVGRNPGMVRT